MAWSSLSERISNLPTIIAGPILRRVETDSVSIWIACKEQLEGMFLIVYDQQGGTILSELTNTVQLGDYLHVAVLTATVDDPAAELEPGVLHSYDILFPDSRTLESAGILNGPESSVGAIEKITYGTSDLPTFVTPTSVIDDLNISHGSCRKPHGGKNDALTALDFILEQSYDNPITRPQQLILTGDQIYADDVADPLLFLLMDAGSVLLGWDEILPIDVKEIDLRPGNRQELIIENNFTSEKAKSHLIHLGEFYAMYLFTWSPELWPPDPPLFTDVYPGHDPYRDGGRKLSNLGSLYNEEMNSLQNFLSTLNKARKVLANISTYMIFDDHEITDDWFLHLEWCENALNGPLSKRIMQNGLSAYTVFQMWGNVPQRFLPTEEGGVLLQALNIVHEDNKQQINSDIFEDLALLILPRLEFDSYGVSRLYQSFSWNFIINFPAYQMLVLDTRTRRAFVSKNEPPILISSEELINQIPITPSGLEVTLLVSPAPVAGHDLVEKLAQPLLKKLSIFSVSHGLEAADYESWSINEKSYQDLLASLVPYGLVIILSGDVHYAFSNAIEYWDERNVNSLGEGVKTACYVQLCSSAQKNEDVKTNAIATDTAQWVTDLLFGLTSNWAGWDFPGYHVRFFDTDAEEDSDASTYLVKVNGDPAMFHIKDSRFSHFDDSPKWRYRIIFAQDSRSQESRGTASTLEPPIPTKKALAFHQTRRRDWDGHRIVVGRDNIGVINLEWGTEKKVIHEFWYVANGDNSNDRLLFPYTRHELNFSKPLLDAVKPGDESSG